MLCLLLFVDFCSSHVSSAFSIPSRLLSRKIIYLIFLYTLLFYFVLFEYTLHTRIYVLFENLILGVSVSRVILVSKSVHLVRSFVLGLVKPCFLKSLRFILILFCTKIIAVTCNFFTVRNSLYSFRIFKVAFLSTFPCKICI